MTPINIGVPCRLREAERFDDGVEKGFAYTVPATDTPIAREVLVHDCWIVNQHGRGHPGLVTPVPIRFCDLLDPD